MSFAPRSDRRVERTRRAVLRAFRELILERGFDGTSVGELVERADIGRSTFYEQFENKDDVLRASVHPIFETLADAALRGDASRVEIVIAHFAEVPKLTREIFGGAARRVCSALLADVIEERLSDVAAWLPSREFAALQIAESELALIAMWLEKANELTAADVARALCAGTTALARALLDAGATRR